MKRAVLIKHGFQSLALNKWQKPLGAVEVVEVTDDASAARIRYKRAFGFWKLKVSWVVDKWISLILIDEKYGYSLVCIPEEEPEVSPEPVPFRPSDVEIQEAVKNGSRIEALEIGDN